MFHDTDCTVPCLFNILNIKPFVFALLHAASVKQVRGIYPAVYGRTGYGIYLACVYTASPSRCERILRRRRHSPAP